jgi:hypothetical protein
VLKKIASLCGVSPVPPHRGHLVRGLATLTLPRPSQAGQAFGASNMPLPMHVTQSTTEDGTSMTFLFYWKVWAYSN